MKKNKVTKKKESKITESERVVKYVNFEMIKPVALTDLNYKYVFFNFNSCSISTNFYFAARKKISREYSEAATATVAQSVKGS